MNRKSILVVDDDEMTRLLIRQSLSESLYNIIEAENGSQGLSLFYEQSPDIVLLDVQLPELNGFEVCRRIRESLQGKDVPVVMITGSDDTASIDKAYQLGATDFIVKPINWSLIEHHIRYILRASYYLESLKKSEKRLEHAQHIARLGHWELDGTDGCLLLSRQIAEMCSLPGTLFGHGLDYLIALIHPADRLFARNIFIKALSNGKAFSLDIRLKLANQSLLYVQLQGRRLESRNSASPVLSGVIQDVTELKRSQHRLVHIAHHDALTDLPNRILFHQQLERAMERAKRRDRKVALLFIDLDRFKNINDSLGHEIGDCLLREVAARFRREIRNYDMVARLGGDEFAIILDAVENVQEALHFIQRIVALFEQPFYLNNKMLYVEASIGISLYPDNASSGEELLRNADMAMYQAKRAELHHFSFYSADLTESTIRRWSLENGLRKALENNDFYLLYQPKVEPGSGHIVGVEALIRWDRGDKPVILPSEFIPVAEETGLLIPLGRWVIQQAVSQLRSWQKTLCAELTIAVNVSGRQLYSDQFTDYVCSVLEKEGVSASLLEIEITEDHLVPKKRDGDCQETLRKLSELGIKMSIDDFGTGYSSLSQLKNLPISTLKIDKSFVDHIPDDEQDVAIVKSILSLAKNLGLEVVAEGVENAQQLACLHGYGCDLIQGYFYSKPVPVDQIEALLESDKCKWLKSCVDTESTQGEARLDRSISVNPSPKGLGESGEKSIISEAIGK
ncbi:two-component system response regulator [Psychromonas ossibalaenae]|uniref:two-component system response regulator n=1 Tax=Psychromonas ossibalaenae TaxID=444922 RepID=UPI0003A7449F|nr:EAL domain-containing protein [Psychromonas ossibalaenae]